jgi:DNA polymerase delta subunit 1
MTAPAKRARKEDFQELKRPAWNVSLDQPVTFMQIDCDYCTERHAQDVTRHLNHKLKDWNHDLEEYPVVRIYGVTQSGASILCRVHGFTPYFYAHCAGGWPNDLMGVMEALERALAACMDNIKKPLVLDVCRKKLKSFMYFRDEDEDFIRVAVAQPRVVAESRRILEAGLSLPDGSTFKVETFESNVPFALRYMVDKDMCGGGWVEAQPEKCFVRPANMRKSTCDLEVDVCCEDLIAHPAEGQWMQLAPIRVMSFDIECMSERGQGFPTPDRNEIIQIAAVLAVLGEKEHLANVVWTLHSCAPIPGATIFSFEDEGEMLLSFRDFITVADPDFISGYNIINFDLPYLIDRANHLGKEDFSCLGRLANTRAKVKDAHFETKALGKRELKEITIEGRVQLDLLVVIQREHKLRSYSLNAVASYFLGDQKEDVHYSIIGDLHRGDENTRRRLATYCLKDALLPMQLTEKLLVMYNFIEMARVTGVPINFLLTRGQMVKVLSMIYRKCRAEGYAVPAKRTGVPEDAFEGATVLEPLCAFYQNPITTLDFASLYPSIMMAHNLCYTTLVGPDLPLDELDPEHVTKSPMDHHFVKTTKREGLLPQILQELLAARKKAKNEMKHATDPLTHSVLNGRQLALKISANSVYGFTGATVGSLPCIEISSSVTAFGREMIEQTKTIVESHYTVANGFEHNALVVYGDTDSVFVKFGTDDVAESMRLGEEAAGLVSKTFIKPVKLEFEKVYFPFLLMNKKRYAGMYWTNPENYDKQDAKGIETVRRDNCQLASDLVGSCLTRILIDRSIEKAVAYVQNVISDLLQNKVDLSLLVVTKQLAKEEYNMRMPHVELANKMRKRDPSTAPVLGDRVPYVITRGAKGLTACEKAEDPLYVLDHDMSIDPDYYIDHQLRQPLSRIFENVVPDSDRLLFAGAHTRKVVNRLAATGAMAHFVQKNAQCVSCKVTVKEGGLCNACKVRGECEIIMEKVQEVRLKEKTYAELWSQCQTCQGSLHQDVLCTSRDCPIFYQRTKVKKDLAYAEKELARLQIDW